MKKAFPLLLCALFLLLLITGCSPKTEPFALESVVICNDFRITLSTSQAVYEKAKMAPEQPLDFTVEIEYIGDDPEIQVWHGGSICAVTMRTQTGEAVLDTAITDELLSSNLKPNEPYTIPWTGRAEYEYVGSFGSGTYIAEAYVDFALDKAFTQRVQCVIQLPFVIE